MHIVDNLPGVRSILENSCTYDEALTKLGLTISHYGWIVRFCKAEGYKNSPTTGKFVKDIA